MAGEGRTRLPASACLSRWEGLGAGRGFGLVRRAGSRAGQERGFPGASEGLNQRLRSVCRLFACLAWAGHLRECELGATVPGASVPVHAGTRGRGRGGRSRS